MLYKEFSTCLDVNTVATKILDRSLSLSRNRKSSLTCTRNTRFFFFHKYMKVHVFCVREEIFWQSFSPLLCLSLENSSQNNMSVLLF